MPNRKHYPKHFILDKKAERGSLRMQATPDPETGEPLMYAISWMDKRPVHMLCSFDAPATSVRRRVKATADVPFHYTTVRFPSAIATYNRSMGGCDLLGMFVHGTTPKLRCRKPYQPIILYFLLAAAHNAKVLYAAKRGKITFALFLVILVEELSMVCIV